MSNFSNYPCVATGVITSRSGERASVEVFGNTKDVSGVQRKLGMIFYASGHSAALKLSKSLESEKGISVIQVRLLSASPL